MHEVDHVRLRDEEGATDPGLERPPEMPRRDADRSPLVWIVAIAVALGLLIAGGVWWSRRGGDAPPTAPPSSDDAPAVAADEPAPEPDVALPTLDQSDAVVRELVARLSSHPQLARWLVTDDLVRRVAGVVGNVAWGEDPRTHLPFLRPSAPFRVHQAGETAIVDPSSFERYDLAVEVFTSLDAPGTAALYRRLRPLLAEAYGELGYPGTWDEAVRNAVRVVLATPAVPEQTELARDVVTYHYLDPDLEALAPAQKLVLRAGPGNAERLKAKLRELASAAGIAR
jgi:hypothetical protein